jgi:hypothetical protein
MLKGKVENDEVNEVSCPVLKRWGCSRARPGIFRALSSALQPRLQYETSSYLNRSY